MMKKMYRSLRDYLNFYYKFQKEIVLVYRGDLKQNWAKRCLFLGDKYQPRLRYNHRSIIWNEVIIEYDHDDSDINLKLANKVCYKLGQDKIAYSKWKSGNKSYHVHFLVNTNQAKNISLLKNVIMRHYGTYYLADNTIYDSLDKVPKAKHAETKKVYPDLRLSALGHLIRAEYGIHEKTGRHKSLVHKTPAFPLVNDVPQGAWERYLKEQTSVVRRRVSTDVKDLPEHDLVKQLLNTVTFKKTMDDGRERIMFILIHILKHKYEDKKELAKYLADWYKYTGGYKMSEEAIIQKVRYHWKRDYRIGINYLKQVIDEVGGKL